MRLCLGVGVVGVRDDAQLQPRDPVNAMIESFWGRMQTRLLNGQRWKTRIETGQRRHSALGMSTPIEFELLHQPAQPVA